jgi:ABC-type branched-subunit amino acid transport system ATPase component
VASSGVTVVVVEQFVRTVAGIADRGVALVGGRIVLDGPIDDLAPRLHAAYFASTEEPTS